jgi:hypothetical protein
MQRAFWETLVDMAEAVAPTAGEAGIRVTSLELDVPIQVQLRQSHGEMEFLADVPRWRWTSDFDLRPCRMRVTLAEAVTGDEGSGPEGTVP